jgi:peptidoglycan L-alanyl-D-glutamate endopeptidase CwlK
MAVFGSKSLARLSTCHPVLQVLMKRAIETAPEGMDFSVVYGVRTKEEQDAAYAAGNSRLKWPKSKHNSSPSMAVDIAPFVNGAISWDWAFFHPLAAHVKATWAAMSDAERGGMKLSWGGDWRSFKDGPHWELSG